MNSQRITWGHQSWTRKPRAGSWKKLSWLSASSFFTGGARPNQSSSSSSSLPSLLSRGITHTSDGLVFKVSATARGKKKKNQLGQTRFHWRPSSPPPPPPSSELPRKNLRWSYHMSLLEAHECTGSSNVCHLNSKIRLGKGRERLSSESEKKSLKFWPSPAI